MQKRNFNTDRFEGFSESEINSCDYHPAPQAKTHVIESLTIGRIKFTPGKINHFSGMNKKSKIQLSYEGDFPEFSTKVVHWENDQVEFSLYPTIAQTAALKKLFHKNKMFNVYIFFTGNKEKKIKRKRIKMTAVFLEMEAPYSNFDDDKPELIVRLLPQHINVK
jgi:hypothetical protein